MRRDRSRVWVRMAVANEKTAPDLCGRWVGFRKGEWVEIEIIIYPGQALMIGPADDWSFWTSLDECCVVGVR